MTSESDINGGIAQRNLIRSHAKLPPLDDREFTKLKAARAERIFEAVFASERARFSRNWTGKESWFSGFSEYSRARKTVRKELRMGQHIDTVLKNLGYKLVEDCWTAEGRKTYLHDENADREFLADLKRTLGQYGWKKHKTKLRCFLNDNNGEVLEVEPGGAETSGHFIRYLKSE
jgi:hypothetical protein